jgi:hypothetical protein
MVRRGAPEGGPVLGRCLVKETSMNEIEILGAVKSPVHDRLGNIRLKNGNLSPPVS